uniref:Transposase n=1 Tax=Rhizobium meliloti TaxID=382 RepID=I2E290_RHIML|nr:transposase [Sinorhizobium meliloti]
MRISAETLQTIAGNPRWLGAEIGVTAVLHTWGDDPPSPCPLPRAGWRSLAGQVELDRMWPCSAAI